MLELFNQSIFLAVLFRLRYCNTFDVHYAFILYLRWAAKHWKTARKCVNSSNNKHKSIKSTIWIWEFRRASLFTRIFFSYLKKRKRAHTLKSSQCFEYTSTSPRPRCLCINKWNHFVLLAMTILWCFYYKRVNKKIQTKKKRIRILRMYESQLQYSEMEQKRAIEKAKQQQQQQSN